MSRFSINKQYKHYRLRLMVSNLPSSALFITALINASVIIWDVLLIILFILRESIGAIHVLIVILHNSNVVFWSFSEDCVALSIPIPYTNIIMFCFVLGVFRCF